MARVPRRVFCRILALPIVASMACGAPPADTSQMDRPGATATQAAGGPSDQLLLAAAKVALPPPGIEVADLPNPSARGAGLLGTYCVDCHALPSPLAHSATDWPATVRRMWLRMERIDSTYGVPVPNDAERFAILDYLLANSLRVSGAALPAGPGRETFSTTCSQCHELPDPRQHTGADWTAVVRRMATHMEAILGVTMPATDLGAITNYLRTVSQP